VKAPSLKKRNAWKDPGQFLLVDETASAALANKKSEETFLASLGKVSRKTGEKSFRTRSERLTLLIFLYPFIMPEKKERSHGTRSVGLEKKKEGGDNSYINKWGRGSLLTAEEKRRERALKRLQR